MTEHELVKILNVLARNNPRGVGFFSLSNETGIKPDRLRGFLQNYKGFFVQLPNEPSYQINRFGEFKGSVDAMVDSHRRYIEKKAKYELLMYVFFAIIFLWVLISLLGEM